MGTAILAALCLLLILTGRQLVSQYHAIITECASGGGNGQNGVNCSTEGGLFEICEDIGQALKVLRQHLEHAAQRRIRTVPADLGEINESVYGRQPTSPSATGAVSPLPHRDHGLRGPAMADIGSGLLVAFLVVALAAALTQIIRYP